MADTKQAQMAMTYALVDLLAMDIDIGKSELGMVSDTLVGALARRGFVIVHDYEDSTKPYPAPTSLMTTRKDVG